LIKIPPNVGLLLPLSLYFFAHNVYYFIHQASVETQKASKNTPRESSLILRECQLILREYSLTLHECFLTEKESNLILRECQLILREYSLTEKDPILTFREYSLILKEYLLTLQECSKPPGKLLSLSRNGPRLIPFPSRRPSCQRFACASRGTPPAPHRDILAARPLYGLRYSASPISSGLKHFRRMAAGSVWE
jgi:hypothetical protein